MQHTKRGAVVEVLGADALQGGREVGAEGPRVGILGGPKVGGAVAGHGKAGALGAEPRQDAAPALEDADRLGAARDGRVEVVVLRVGVEVVDGGEGRRGPGGEVGRAQRGAEVGLDVGARRDPLGAVGGRVGDDGLPEGVGLGNVVLQEGEEGVRVLAGDAVLEGVQAGGCAVGGDAVRGDASSADGLLKTGGYLLGSTVNRLLLAVFSSVLWVASDGFNKGRVEQHRKGVDTYDFS